MGDKWLAHVFFEEHGIPSPRSWLPETCRATLAIRCSSRSARASGRVTSTVRSTREQLELHLRSTPVDSFVQELCRGEEFSIDVFCDLAGRCLNAIPRTMIQSKGGESIKGCSVATGS